MAIAALGFCLSVLIGIIGIDFGHHWDECVILRYEINRWLPQEYGYPSMTYNISHFAIASHLAAKAVRFRIEDASTWRERLRRYTDDERNQNRMKLISRSVCLVISQLTIVAVFLIVAGAFGGWEACLACLFLSFSNEFLYHSRWSVPDTLMAFWSTATVACILLSLRRNSMKLLYAAAVLTGLAIATKYTTIFLLCPLCACCLMLPHNTRGQGLRRCLLLIIAATAAFFLVCPGIIIENEKFWRTLSPVVCDYTSGLGGYTVEPWLPHLARMLVYITTQHFSDVMAINLALSVFCLWGLVSWMCVRKKEMALTFIYLIFFTGFIASYKIMLVRNLMVLFPFLAIFTARGIVSVGSLLPRRPKRLLYACILSALAVTAAIEMKDAIEIHRHAHDYDYPLARALEYITKDAGHRYYIHENIRDALARRGKLPPNATANAGEADFILAFPPVFPHDIENSPFVFKEWFGTREMNYRYYSTWQWRTYGMKRDKLNPVILDRGNARKFGLI
ncbi:MAG: glycosyltransferase family 39 protein [Candidatus Aureabacteria bacterium]|nr:glycosyltransferase family 39 protein [Candidatus Auribacterota bacterium]